MKKGWKIFGIVCGSVAGLGLVLCVIAFALGFTFSDTSSYFKWFGWNRHYSSDGSSVRYTGSMDGTGEEFTDVSKLDVDVAQVEVDIQQYDGNTIKVEQADVSSRLKLDIYQEDQTLYVETNNKFQVMLHDNYGVIRIYLPKTMKLSEVDLSVGAGELFADGIQASTMDVEVGAGRGEVTNFKVDELSADCGAGEMELSGNSGKKADMECGIGRISYQVAGQEKDYNYDIESGIGSIEIGGSSFTGLAQEKKIDNGGSREMIINCGVGEVIVNFDEG